MSFLLTIYNDDSNWSAELDRGATKELIDAYWALDAEAREKGVYIESVGLHPAATAKSLQIRDGQESVTDGPFAETKEQLGGFYLLDCDSMEEALAWAAKIPAARTGSVEVREVMDYEAAGFGDPTGEAARST
jgi:hypothetical protein